MMDDQLTIVPDVLCYSFSSMAPRIEHMNHRFTRVLARLVHRWVNNIRVVLIDPWGCPLIVWMSCWSCWLTHDTSAPLGLILISWRSSCRSRRGSWRRLWGRMVVPGWVCHEFKTRLWRKCSKDSVLWLWTVETWIWKLHSKVDSVTA